MTFHIVFKIIAYASLFPIVLTAHQLKKFLLKRQSSPKWQNFRFPFKRFLVFLGLNFFLLLPVLLDSVNLWPCRLERLVGVFPLGREGHAYWLLICAPLHLFFAFQIYDNKFLPTLKPLRAKILTIIINLITAISISLLLLFSVGGSIFSSSWPCEIEGENNAPSR